MSRLDWWPHDAEGTCPEPEQVAALVDGGLGEPERSEVSRHLSACSRCYELFSGTAALLEDEGAGAGAAAPAAWARGWLPLAAVIACVAVGAVLYRGVRPSPPSAGNVLSTFAVSAGPGVEPWPVSVVRGTTPTTAGPTSAFEVGLLLADLRALDRRGDREAMRPRFLRLAALLDSAGFVDKEAARARREAEATSGSGAPAIDALAQGLAERFDADELTLGAWTEAGRLSALAQDRTFFEERSSRRTLDRARARQSSADAPALDDLEAAWPTRGAQPDWPRLTGAFGRIAQTRVR